MPKNTFDKKLPHGTVHGIPAEPGKAAPAYEQGGRFFDVHHNDLGSSDSTVAAAEREAKPGHGNIGHGNFDPLFKPLEEGGAGAGKTESFPQTTTEGQRLLDDDDKDTLKSGSESRASAAADADAAVKAATAKTTTAKK